MGTRADFYVGKGKKAKYLGSIAWDGYPEGVDEKVLKAKTKAEFEKAVLDFLKDRDDSTAPSQGWPWPWDNSQTTDYAYLFDKTEVKISCFGRKLRSYSEFLEHNEAIKKLNKKLDKETVPEKQDKIQAKIDELEDSFWPDGKEVTFPDMKEKKAVDLGKRSGLIIIR